MQPLNLLSFSPCGSICSTGLLAQPQFSRGHLQKHLSLSNKVAPGNPAPRRGAENPSCRLTAFSNSRLIACELSARPSATLKWRREAVTRARCAPLDRVMASAAETGSSMTREPDFRTIIKYTLRGTSCQNASFLCVKGRRESFKRTCQFLVTNATGIDFLH